MRTRITGLASQIAALAALGAPPIAADAGTARKGQSYTPYIALDPREKKPREKHSKYDPRHKGRRR